MVEEMCYGDWRKWTKEMEGEGEMKEERERKRYVVGGERHRKTDEAIERKERMIQLFSFKNVSNYLLQTTH